MTDPFTPSWLEHVLGFYMGHSWRLEVSYDLGNPLMLNLVELGCCMYRSRRLEQESAINELDSSVSQEAATESLPLSISSRLLLLVFLSSFSSTELFFL